MSHTTTNNILRQRLIHILLVIIVIITGLIFAQPAEAGTAKRKKSSVTRKVSSKRNSNKACYQLYKKRTESRNRGVVASTSRKPKYKPMAETDSPMKVASM